MIPEEESPSEYQALLGRLRQADRATFPDELELARARHRLGRRAWTPRGSRPRLAAVLVALLFGGAAFAAFGIWKPWTPEFREPLPERTPAPPAEPREGPARGAQAEPVPPESEVPVRTRETPAARPRQGWRTIEEQLEKGDETSAKKTLEKLAGEDPKSAPSMELVLAELDLRAHSYDAAERRLLRLQKRPELPASVHLRITALLARLESAREESARDGAAATSDNDVPAEH